MAELDLYALPERACFNGRLYRLHTDFRNILLIFRQLEDRSVPEAIRWRVAAGLFYTPALHRQDYSQGLTYLARFLTGGREDTAPGPRLMDWQQDAGAIIAGVNAVAGREIRSEPHIHWWTFLSWFHAMGQGELSTRIAVRDKLRRGKKLEPWEQEFYRENKASIDLKPRYTPQELAERQRLEERLGN